MSDKSEKNGRTDFGVTREIMSESFLSEGAEKQGSAAIAALTSFEAHAAKNDQSEIERICRNEF